MYLLVLLDEHGHVYLTDFNIACHFSKDESKKLRSVAGTMVYMAPELFTEGGYRSSIDWWSLGVIMFELIFGKRPFKGRTPDDLVANISTKDVQQLFPKSKTCSQECLDCISGVRLDRLNIVPDTRHKQKAGYIGIWWIRESEKVALFRLNRLETAGRENISSAIHSREQEGEC